MKVIAFCTDALVFLNNRILQPELGQKYPGALWVSELAAIAAMHHIEVMTGDVALERINEGMLAATQVWIIQEDEARLAQQLLQKGAHALALLCGESPLYARKFYKRLPKLSLAFPHRFVFRGAFKDTVGVGSNHIFFFPSFSRTADQAVKDWSQRKLLVMVAANKYWRPQRALLRRVAAQTRDWILGRNTWVTGKMKRQQLHDRRLELIEYFGKDGSLELFGMGWNDLGILPKTWELRLKNIIQRLAPVPCDNKINLISNYKFSLCLENYVYPGYVTEKIIDCFQAGVIPVYLGAPDIEEFFPKDSFFDLRDFDSFDQLKAAILGIGEQEAARMVNSGKKFLLSEAGLQYSYEGVAQSFMRTFLEETSK